MPLIGYNLSCQQEDVNGTPERNGSGKSVGGRVFIALVMFIAASIVSLPGAGATTLQSTVLSPNDGLVSSSPDETPEPHHRPYGGNYSFDVAGGGSAFARFRNTTGNLRLSVVAGSIKPACKSGNFADGGEQISLNVTVNDTNVGVVTYAHLTNFPIRSGNVPVGARIGDIVTAAHGVRPAPGVPPTRQCWTGPHVHVEPRNAQSFGCFFPGLFQSQANASTPLGIVGGERATRVNQPCPRGAEAPTTPVPTTSVPADTTAPSVRINQGSGQPDPTSNSPVRFDVVFSEPVSGFASGDVNVGGAAGATQASIAGSGARYTVSVSGMTTGGTVTASIPAGRATDRAGNANVASTSTDNTVRYVVPTTTEVQSSSNPANFGNAVTFTATVKPSGGTGTVTFTNGTATLGTSALDSAGQARFTTSTLGVGNHQITATYGGDSRFAGSAGSLNQRVRNTVSINDVTLTDIDVEPVSGKLTATLAAPSNETLSVDYATVDGTAISGEHYEATTGTLTFAPGETSKVIPVTALAQIEQTDRDFSVVLSNPSENLALADDRGQVTIVVDHPSCTIVGTAGRDDLEGSEEDDVICGLAGNDELDGGSGNDMLYGGEGDDYLEAGPGNDTLRGGSGNDSLDGEPGNDTLIGGPGDDTLEAGTGDDTLEGGDGDDTLDGETGDNRLDGGPGRNTCELDDDDIVINCGSGDDRSPNDTTRPRWRSVWNRWNAASSVVDGDGSDHVKGKVGNDPPDGGSEDSDCETGDDDTATSCQGGTGSDSDTESGNGAESRSRSLWARWNRAPSPEAPARSSSPLENADVVATGMGPVRIGMTLAEAEEVAGDMVPVRSEKVVGSCQYVAPEDGPKGVKFMAVDGRIARIDVATKANATPSGASIGDSQDEVIAMFPGQIDTSQRYRNGDQLLTFVPQDPAQQQFRVIFETDGSKVTGYRAGQLPAVEFEAGCL